MIHSKYFPLVGSSVLERDVQFTGELDINFHTMPTRRLNLIRQAIDSVCYIRSSAVVTAFMSLTRINWIRRVNPCLIVDWPFLGLSTEDRIDLLNVAKLLGGQVTIHNYLWWKSVDRKLTATFEAEFVKRTKPHRLGRLIPEHQDERCNMLQHIDARARYHVSLHYGGPSHE